MTLGMIIFIQYLLASLNGLTAGIMFEIGNSPSGEPISMRNHLVKILPFWVMELVLMLIKLMIGTPILPIWLNMIHFTAVIGLLITVFHLKTTKMLFWLMAWIGSSWFAEFMIILANPEIVTQAMNWTRENVLPLLLTTEIMALVFRVLFGLMIRRKDSFGWKDPQLFMYLCITAGVVISYPILRHADRIRQEIYLNAYLPQAAFASLIIFAYVIIRWMHARFRMNIEKTEISRLIISFRVTGMMKSLRACVMMQAIFL